ncbi:MAG: hypothetical protein NTX50_06145 [Candidatus Sumerlaeota bacterium]|nr:hypothetical protein [Candidatus Sumerlaeota bacterium]
MRLSKSFSIGFAKIARMVILTAVMMGIGSLLFAQTTNTLTGKNTASLGTELFNFALGMLGATCMYLYWFRTTRIQKVIASYHTGEKGSKPSIIPGSAGWKSIVPEGRILIYDFVISIFLGGIVAVFISSSENWKEAFLIGCTWNSIFARFAKEETKERR